MVDRSADLNGRTRTDRLRIRQWLFGVVIEVLVEDDDGARSWVKYPFPIPLDLNKAK